MLKAIIILLLSFSPHAFSDSLSIFFLGDTYFGESYQTNPKYNGGVNAIEKYGYDYFFENVKDLLNASDYIIVNFESPLCGNKNVSSLKPYIHWCDVNNTLKYLKKYKINAVSLGNNHSMDMGYNGLIGSISNCENSGLQCFGAGQNSYSMNEPLLAEFIKGGSKFQLAVIGGFEYRASYDTIYNFYSRDSTAGVHALSTEKITAKVKSLKEKNKNLFIVFYPHWGKNYKQTMDYQKEMAHALIDAGADLIIGHGAHTVQEAEYYNGKWIIYNIGNFIFNAPGRYSSTGAKPYGLMAELVVTSNSKKLRLYPIFTDNNKSDYQLRFLDEEEFVDCSRVLGNKESINKLSGERNYFEIKLN